MHNLQKPMEALLPTGGCGGSRQTTWWPCCAAGRDGPSPTPLGRHRRLLLLLPAVAARAVRVAWDSPGADQARALSLGLGLSRHWLEGRGGRVGEALFLSAIRRRGTTVPPPPRQRPAHWCRRPIGTITLFLPGGRAGQRGYKDTRGAPRGASFPIVRARAGADSASSRERPANCKFPCPKARVEEAGGQAGRQAPAAADAANSLFQLPVKSRSDGGDTSFVLAFHLLRRPPPPPVANPVAWKKGHLISRALTPEYT